MIYIQGGEFYMGSPEAEEGRSADEKLHYVTVRDFYVSPYEVSQDEYMNIMGINPSIKEYRDNAVNNVSVVNTLRITQSLWT